MTNTIDQDREDLKQKAKEDYAYFRKPLEWQRGFDAAWQASAQLQRERKADEQQSEPLGEMRCDATTGHVYSVFWYANSPAIGSKVYTAPPTPRQSVD